MSTNTNMNKMLTEATKLTRKNQMDSLNKTSDREENKYKEQPKEHNSTIEKEYKKYKEESDVHVQKYQ